MKPSDLARALTALIPTKQPTFVWGPPGIGKSSVVQQVAANLNMKLTDIRATLLDAVDLRGLPSVQNDRTAWMPPAFLPRPEDGPTLVFLDELPQAEQAVQKGCFQLINDRRVGEYELPHDCVVLAAGNRTEDRAGANRTNTALNNRLLHLDVEVDVDDWQAWAAANAVCPEVRAFVRFKPTLLFKFDPKENPREFPSPRSWSFVSRVLPSAPKDLVRDVVSGAVGEGPAVEFAGFLALYQQLPDIDAVLRTPSTASIPTEPAVLYSLVGAVVEKVRSDRKKADAAVTYAKRMPDEFGMLALRDLLAVDKTLVRTVPGITKWVADARAKGLFASLSV
jgi:hypothetical protein